MYNLYTSILYIQGIGDSVTDKVKYLDEIKIINLICTFRDYCTLEIYIYFYPYIYLPYIFCLKNKIIYIYDLDSAG